MGRAREIGDWLQKHPEVTVWVAIDDIDFKWADGLRVKGTPLVKYRSVRTDAQRCLNEEDAKEAIRILNSPTFFTPEEEIRLQRRLAQKLAAAYPMLKEKYVEEKEGTVP